MTKNSQFPPAPAGIATPLEDLGAMFARYQAAPISDRAQIALSDTESVLRSAEQVLSQVGSNPKIKQSLEKLRGNVAITGKMRSSEAKNILMEDGGDFLDITRKKLSSWRKTMSRLTQKEGVLLQNGKEYIASDSAVVPAIYGLSTVPAYLSVIQVLLQETARIDEENAAQYHFHLTKIRRCATLLSDCEHAASFAECIR